MCEQTVILYDPAARSSRTPKSEAVKAIIRCTLDHDPTVTWCGARLSDSEPEAVITWNSTSPTPSSTH